MLGDWQSSMPSSNSSGRLPILRLMHRRIQAGILSSIPNTYRRRWVMIAVEVFGTSFLGEVWYAEANTPQGPWAYAVKIVTHDRYDFYNPKQHLMFDKANGRVIFFEGTYSNTFSGNPVST